jgi:hypothetical protein
MNDYKYLELASQQIVHVDGTESSCGGAALGDIPESKLDCVWITVLSETAGGTYLKLAETMFQRQRAKSTSHDEQIDGF